MKKELVHPELTEDQTQKLRELVETFLSEFSVPGEKETAVKQLKLVFNMIKNPSIADNFKTISLANEKFKRIKQSNKNFLDFLAAIGFTKTEGRCPVGSDAKYSFVQSEEPEEGALMRGNNKNLEFILTLI